MLTNVLTVIGIIVTIAGAKFGRDATIRRYVLVQYWEFFACVEGEGATTRWLRWFAEKLRLRAAGIEVDGDLPRPWLLITIRSLGRNDVGGGDFDGRPLVLVFDKIPSLIGCSDPTMSVATLGAELRIEPCLLARGTVVHILVRMIVPKTPDGVEGLGQPGKRSEKAGSLSPGLVRGLVRRWQLAAPPSLDRQARPFEIPPRLRDTKVVIRAGCLNPAVGRLAVAGLIVVSALPFVMTW